MHWGLQVALWRTSCLEACMSTVVVVALGACTRASSHPVVFELKELAWNVGGGTEPSARQQQHAHKQCTVRPHSESVAHMKPQMLMHTWNHAWTAMHTEHHSGTAMHTEAH